MLTLFFCCFQEDRPVESYDFHQTQDLDSFCQLRLGQFSTRTLDLMLLEMRKMDRDREKIIHPATIENLVHKYKVPITPCLDSLLGRHEHKTFGGLVNYEDLMQYLQDSRQKGSRSSIQEYFDHNDNRQPRDQTVTIKKGRRERRRASSADSSHTKNVSQTKSQADVKDSDLGRELSISLQGQSKEVSSVLHFSTLTLFSNTNRLKGWRRL